MTRQDIYKIINNEREYQDDKWKDDTEYSSEPHKHEIASWILYMEDYLQEARNIASRNSPETSALHPLRKVVGMGVACFEQHGVPDRIWYKDGVLQTARPSNPYKEKYKALVKAVMESNCPIDSTTLELIIDQKEQ